jgi:hypothetical protein
MRLHRVHIVLRHLDIEFVFGRSSCGPQTGDHARGCWGSDPSRIGPATKQVATV